MTVSNKLTSIAIPCQISYIQAKETHSLKRVPILNPSIIWVKKGVKQLFWQDQKETIQTGYMMLLPENSEFYITNYANEHGYLAEVISLSNQLLQAFIQQHQINANANFNNANRKNFVNHFNNREHNRFGIKPTKHVQQAVSHLIQGFENQAPSSILQRYAEVVLMSLYESKVLHLLNIQDESTKLLSDEVKQTLLMQPDNHWSIDTLAKKFNMSSATFRRNLANENNSYRKILDDVRLGIALGEVQSNQLSIQQITLKVGYQCPSQFSAKFKKRFGMTPSELRKTI